jgi:hypothetical protein
MSRYSAYGQLDTQAVTEGDSYFKGLDLKHERASLGEGMLARSENKRLATGKAQTRKGSILPSDFNGAFANNIWGGSAFVYSNPNGPEVTLMATVNNAYVHKFQDGVAPSTVSSPGHSMTQPVWFVQAFEKVLLLRQAGLTPLVWTGAENFIAITKSDPGDTSTLLIPNVAYGVPFQNRILYVFGRDQIIMSDVLDYTSYDPVFSLFRINAGESDQIYAIVPYDRQSVVIFMQRSIHRLSNFTTDPELAEQELITDQMGMAIGTAPFARKSIVQVGADHIFLSNPGGFFRLSEVYESRTMAQPIPISDKIQPLIDQINWNPVNGCGLIWGAVLGVYAYWGGVPIGPDGAVRYVTLVYNTTTNEWESIDTRTPALALFTDGFITNYNNQRRLFAVHGFARHVRLLDEGEPIDHDPSGDVAVTDIIETRGYGMRSGSGPGGFKRFLRMSAALSTLNPSVTFTAISDGENEEKLLTLAPITKNPNKSYLWGRTPIGGEAKKEDYFASDYTADPQTQSLERRLIRQTGRWCSIRISNTQGICDIHEVSVDAQEKQNVVRVAA